jgi:hypothetical protein
LDIGNDKAGSLLPTWPRKRPPAIVNGHALLTCCIACGPEFEEAESLGWTEIKKIEQMDWLAGIENMSAFISSVGRGQPCAGYETATEWQGRLRQNWALSVFKKRLPCFKATVIERFSQCSQLF